MNTPAIAVAIAITVAIGAASFEAGAADPAAGATKAVLCIACHGADGISPTPQFPNLAGQHADYIVQTLKDYKSGARSNPVMRGFVGALSEQDMEDIAAFYAGKPGLFTPSVKD